MRNYLVIYNSTLADFKLLKYLPKKFITSWKHSVFFNLPIKIFEGGESLNNSKKILLRVAFLVCLSAGLLTATYGAIFITSNQVRLDIQYLVDLSIIVEDSEVTLAATVTNNGNPVGAGYVVDFYVSADDGVIWVHFDSQTTNGQGIAQTTYITTTNGVYDFKAIATIP